MLSVYEKLFRNSDSFSFPSRNLELMEYFKGEFNARSLPPPPLETHILAKSSADTLFQSPDLVIV